MPQQLLTIAHHLARITLHNPPAHVLTSALLQELDGVLDEVEDDPYVRVVLLTGSGRFFCAGADIHELAHLTAAREGSDFSARGQALLNRLERFDKPVIAAVNGTCVGGGLELALACHIRIAAAGSMLGLPETKLGLIPGFGGTQRLPRLIGLSNALELLLGGELISAEEARLLGLVGRVVPQPELVPEAERIGLTIAARGERAVRSVLRAVRGSLDLPFAEGLAREAELFGDLCATRDKDEAVQAFLAGRRDKAGNRDR